MGSTCRWRACIPVAHKLLQLAGVMDEIGEQRIYDTVRNAVDAATSSAVVPAEGGSEAEKSSSEAAG